MYENIDKVLCLHCLEDTERYEHITKELDKVGLLSKCYISEFTKLPLNKKIGNMLTELHTPYYNSFKHNVYGAVFSCMYNWLQLISWAYKKGYQHILCIEDDITFQCDKEELNTYINSIPSNAHIAFLGWGFPAGYLINGSGHYRLAQKRLDKKFIKVSESYRLTGTFGVYMNREGMEYYLNEVQSTSTCADLLWSNMHKHTQHLNIYIANKLLISPEWGQNGNSLITTKNEDN